MQSLNLHNFTTGALRNRPQNSPLSTDQLLKAAPSIFAESPSTKTSNKYLFIPTSNFVEVLANQGYMPTKASQSRSNSNALDGRIYAKHMIRFRHESNFDLCQKVGDTVPELILINSHDGASSFQLSSGLFRLVCSNGLMVGDSVQTQRITHQAYNQLSVIEATYKVLQDSEKLTTLVPALQDIDLTQPEQIALASAALDYRYPDAMQTKPSPEKLLTIRRREDQKTDLWTTFNRIQENMLKGGLRTFAKTTDAHNYTHTRRNTTRAVNSVSEESRLNKALWNLTEHFAAIKTENPIFAKISQKEVVHA